MNIVILVFAVVSMNSIYKYVGNLVGSFLPKKWWITPITKIVGLAVGLVYLYFAGYYIMAKDANLFRAAIVALLPFAISIVIMAVQKVRLIEE